MDRQLASAVIATFRNADAADHARRLQVFPARRWRRNFHWLDASGLALYFLRRVHDLGIVHAIPPAILDQLEQRYIDNSGRTASLFDEFARLNVAFRSAGIQYVNLKGFTLAPDYCPDLSLRYQMDCDVLVDARDGTRCGDILRSLGYSLIAEKQDVLEFKTDAGCTPTIRELYKARPQRSVEVHLCDDRTSEFRSSLLQRSVACTQRGHTYPALCAEDLFFSQASHILRHLRSEWTRASWLLEFRNFITARRDDCGFWHALEMKCAERPGPTLAIGVAVHMAEKAFGEFAPEGLKAWTSSRLPRPVALWIERYANAVLLTDFPGSKLYLLLESAIRGEGGSGLVRARLFPHRAPAPIVAPPAHNFRARLSSTWRRWSYFFFRLRFHMSAGLRYFVEWCRWNRALHEPDTNDKGYSARCAANAAD